MTRKELIEEILKQVPDDDTKILSYNITCKKPCSRLKFWGPVNASEIETVKLPEAKL